MALYNHLERITRSRMIGVQLNGKLFLKTEKTASYPMFDAVQLVSTHQNTKLGLLPRVVATIAS